MNRSSRADLHESWELSAREVLIPLLRPGEPLRIALSGHTAGFDGLTCVDLVLALLYMLSREYTSRLSRTTYIGITDDNLVFAISKDPKIPSHLERVPLSNVSIVKFKENRTPFLSDVLVIETRTKRLTLSTRDSQRPPIRELEVTLARQRQEAHRTSSTGLLQGTQAQHELLLLLHVHLFHPLASAMKDLTTTLLVDGPARASV